MGYNSHSNLVKLIDMDLNLEEKFKEFEMHLNKMKFVKVWFETLGHQKKKVMGSNPLVCMWKSC